MRKVSVKHLKPGLKLGRTVYGADGEVLLSAGCLLTENYIKKLSAWGINFVFIDEGLLPDVNVEDVVSAETRQAAVSQIKKILLETRESGRLVIDPGSIYATVEGFTRELLAKKELMVNLIDLRLQDDYTFAHSVNVCILSLLTGITLGLDGTQLTLLGTGALLHDVGKIMIPDSILNKPGPLAPEEFRAMMDHAQVGYELITSSGAVGELPALIARQHHENYDGSGYPLQLKGTEIHPLAQAVAAADKFDALTADRVYRKGFPPHEAYEMLAACGNSLIEAGIVKAFLHNIAAYPSGSLVELTSGEVAVVVDTPKGYSLFPRVRVLTDPKHRLLAAPREVFLLEVDGLAVARLLPASYYDKLIQKN